MIIFDKLKEMLFTEVETEEYVEEIEEEKELERKVVSKEKTVVYEKKKVEPKIQPVEVQVTNVEQKNDTYINIKADGPKKEEKVDRRLKPLERKEFEIPVVISPINGSDEEMKPVTKTTEFGTTQPVKAAKNKNSLGTVISPFYGTGELEEFQAKAKIELEQDAQRDDTFSDDEIENISLDQMISPVVEEENEMIQFSLFGENKPVKMFAEEETSIDDEEKEEELPF